jgi:hypothetical protein
MEIIAGTIVLALTGASVILWLYIRENGMAYFWGRLAARTKANHEASILREMRDKQLMEQWCINKQLMEQWCINEKHESQNKAQG